ncbi:MAG: STAS domain-containing protein [Planctomycetes bacterium]|nr:STAS domain-containing protein [Planctomycetota bacterium]
MAGSGLVISHVQGVTFASLRRASILDGVVIDDIGEALFELIDAKDCRKLVVDFRAVNFLASQMIGVLITLDNKARAIKGKVVLCGLRDSLMKVFKITRLDKRLTFASDETEALREFDIKAGD